MGNSKVKKFLTDYFLILILAVLVLSVVHSTTDEELDDDKHYCEMVKIFKDSDGENGWPDYKNTYANLCDT